MLAQDVDESGSLCLGKTFKDVAPIPRRDIDEPRSLNICESIIRTPPVFRREVFQMPARDVDQSGSLDRGCTILLVRWLLLFSMYNERLIPTRWDDSVVSLNRGMGVVVTVVCVSGV